MKKLADIQPAELKEKITKYLVSVKQEMESLFGIKIADPNIIFVASRKEIDELKGKKTESWLIGWVGKDGTIYILNPDVYEQESNHKIAHFWKALKHEYIHLYFEAAAGVNYPVWLNEGLAKYLAGQLAIEPTDENKMRVFYYFRKFDSAAYHIGYFWVTFLIEKFGIEKILELVKSLKEGMTEDRNIKPCFKSKAGFI